MKSFSIPEDIQIVDPLSGKEGDKVSFVSWFFQTVLNDQRMGLTPAKLARVVKLSDQAKDWKPGSKPELEDADFETVKKIVEEPQNTMGGVLFSSQLLPFSTAVLSAT